MVTGLDREKKRHKTKCKIVMYRGNKTDRARHRTEGAVQRKKLEDVRKE